jgi:hypothetical protein
METTNSTAVPGKNDSVARIHPSLESTYPKKIERLQEEGQCKCQRLWDSMARVAIFLRRALAPAPGTEKISHHPADCNGITGSCTRFRAVARGGAKRRLTADGPGQG